MVSDSVLLSMYQSQFNIDHRPSVIELVDLIKRHKKHDMTNTQAAEIYNLLIRSDKDIEAFHYIGEDWHIDGRMVNNQFYKIIASLLKGLTQSFVYYSEDRENQQD